MSEHTSGPWSHVPRTLVSVCGSTTESVIFDQDGTPLAFVSADTESGIANASLIAAAPELLQAAKSVLAFYDGLDRCHDDGEPEILDALSAVIAKAEGK